MPVDPVARYSGLEVLPLYPSLDALCENELFIPNTTFKRGALVGYITSASQAEIQTLNFSGSGDVPTGGTFTLSIVGIDGGTYTSAALAYNIANADLDTAIEALLDVAGYHGATVALTNGPAPADVTVTFGGTSLYKDMPLMTGDASSLTSSGTATLTVDATQAGITKGLWAPYDDDGSNDGRRTASGIVRRDFRTDYWGRVIFASMADPTYGSVSGGTPGPQNGEYEQSAPVWKTGIFQCSDLWKWDGSLSAYTQYPDAAAVADLGRLLRGAYTDSTGVLSVR